MNVNTDPDTWKVKDGLLVCSGCPIGVMRSARQDQWFRAPHRVDAHGGRRQLRRGRLGATPGPTRSSGSPTAWKCRCWSSSGRTCTRETGRVTPPIAYVHGELFGVGGVEIVPDNPRGERSMSIENLCRGRGEWNTYDVVAVDGVVKLSVNGKFVNGVSRSTRRKGYLCLESEGAEIHFRNIRILELPPGVTRPDQVAPALGD